MPWRHAKSSKPTLYSVLVRSCMWTSHFSNVPGSGKRYQTVPLASRQSSFIPVGNMSVNDSQTRYTRKDSSDVSPCRVANSACLLAVASLESCSVGREPSEPSAPAIAWPDFCSAGMAWPEPRIFSWLPVLFHEVSQ